MQAVLFALIGGVLGIAVPGGTAGFAAGAVLGALVAWVGRLQERIVRLEREIASARTTAAEAPTSEATTSATQPPSASAPTRQTPGRAKTQQPIPAKVQPPAAPKRSRLVQDTEPSALERAFAALARWLTSGNVPVKVGVLLSVFEIGRAHV